MRTFKLLMCAAVLTAPAVQAKDVKFLFSLALPPYVINEAGKAPSGFELEIIREALAAKGHTLKPEFVAMGAIPKMLNAGQADGGQRGSPELKEGAGYFYAAEPTVVYQDVAITLRSENLPLASVADVKGKSIIGFQGASHFLGADFAAAVKGNPKYAETSHEQRRVMQLYAKGAQVYVGDINVFKYYRAAASGVDTKQEIDVHKVFAPSNQKINNAVFRDKQIRDDFDAGLKQIKASGQYKKIVKKYISE